MMPLKLQSIEKPFFIPTFVIGTRVGIPGYIETNCDTVTATDFTFFYCLLGCFSLTLVLALTAV